jgi:hypothetical protein
LLEEKYELADLWIVEEPKTQRLGSQISKVSQLWKVCKSKKLLRSENLRICDLRNLFADCPPLVINIGIYNVIYFFGSCFYY